MEKKRLFKIMAKAHRDSIIDVSNKIRNEHEIVIVKSPEKVLAMVKMREPVKESLFYIGEVIVTEAVVSIDGVNGMAVAMGDDYDKTLAMAVIDAASNSGLIDTEATFKDMERKQIENEEKENAMYKKTMVDFHSMDSEG